MTYGATDEWGYWAVEGKTKSLDVFATTLKQLGIDHEKFTYKFQGRLYRLTFGAVEEGQVINQITRNPTGILPTAAPATSLMVAGTAQKDPRLLVEFNRRLAEDIESSPGRPKSVR